MSSNHLHVWAASTASLLLLAACSSGDAATPEVPVTPIAAESPKEPVGQATATPTPTPEPTTEQPDEESIYGPVERNERGNLVKALGQLAGMTNLEEEVIAEFTVTAIEPNFTCTNEWAEPPVNGQYIAVTLDVTTTAALAEQEWPSVDFNPYDFKVISPEGTRENDSVGNGFTCLNESEALPLQIGPGEHVTGKIVLDSAYPSGSLVYAPMGYEAGWEWGF